MSKAFPLEPGWQVVLKDLGVRPADVLIRAGLPADLFGREGVRLSTEAYFRLWEGLEAEVDDPLFPLALGEVIRSESFMPPIFAACCSPNFAIAAERLSKYKRLIAPMALDISETGGTFELSFRWLDATVVPPQSLATVEMVFITRLIRMATRENIRALRVVLSRPPGRVAEYKAFFGVEVTAGDAHSIMFSMTDVYRPFLTANQGMWKIFEPDLRRRLAELDESASTVERVRSALLEALPSGQSSMELVSAKLGMSKRTLQRRLRGEGATYQGVLNTTREELSKHYLSSTALSCAEISFLVGFDDPNSFFRAFHMWTGDTPERVRQAALH